VDSFPLLFEQPGAEKIVAKTPAFTRFYLLSLAFLIIYRPEKMA